MDSAFTIEINNIRFNFLSMNVQRAQLFQVYVNFQGQKRRFHFKEDGKGGFIFAMREDCPPEILTCEQQLSDHILELAKQD
ncbi:MULTISPECIES: hypothetical protein [Mucilaginibacter]|uniref:Uncharacterized protein n=2 Tax=Mucilaginibacter TaxID=423349 RepID=A0A5B8US83_9SPHI|nr:MULTISPECIES: hypothetical protein [Mucilaginibacter]MBE9668109.1 hypothetical protein [Mucilaginibacter boryungensis]QEC61957.1 hypothetical protein FRZ54_04935 [Mucilaginibacter ginsenosidivorans]